MRVPLCVYDLWAAVLLPGRPHLHLVCARVTCSDVKQIPRNQKISTNQYAHSATTRHTKEQTTDKKTHLEPTIHQYPTLQEIEQRQLLKQLAISLTN